MAEWTERWLEHLLFMTPLWVVSVAGIAVALATWRRHRGVSLLVLLASALMVLSVVFGSMAGFWLGQEQQRAAGNPERLEQLDWWLSMIYSSGRFVYAAAFALLVVAAFGWRTRSRWATPPDPKEL